MSRTPGKSGDDPTAAPTMAIGPEPSMPSPPIVIDVQGDLSEGVNVSAEQDDEILARDAQAAADGGDGHRADALLCARALLAERQADDGAALALWRSAFDRDPTLLVAFWGLRRTFWRQGAWTELQAVLQRRIAAIVSGDRTTARADLWLEYGRIFEDRLQQDDRAAQSYRAGLIEAPDHAGLLTALLLLGARVGDPSMAVEALSGFLQHQLPPVQHASISAALARIERTSVVSAAATTHANPAASESASQRAGEAPLDPATAARALATLQAALREVGDGDAGPLIAELSALARVTADPALRAEMLDHLVARLSPDAKIADAGSVNLRNREWAAALLRERARLLRDGLDDHDGAAASLRAALARAPGHPGVLTELADTVEMLAGDDTAESTAGLRDLLVLAAPGERAFETEAESELAIRYITALARDGRAADGLALLERHPELPRDRLDVFAIEIFLRAAIGDAAGLVAALQRVAGPDDTGVGNISDAAGDQASDESGAHALVVAGTLLEADHSRNGQAFADGIESESVRLYRRALERVPGYRPAEDALERSLWNVCRWRELADFLQAKLIRAGVAAIRPGDGRTESDLTAGMSVEASRDARRGLEDLVALLRDHLDDPGAARHFQNQLLGPDRDAVGSGDIAHGARAWTRRHDLELAAAVHGQPSESAARVRILRELAVRAGVPSVAAALRVEAARVAISDDDPTTAQSLLREAVAADVSGSATSGLERLTRAQHPNPGAAAARADLVREEVARLVATRDASATDASESLRALRFRVAWHAQGAQQPSEALDALAPLRARGDPVARAWSWEIARRSGQPALQASVLRELPSGDDNDVLELPTDLPDALERSGDLAAAEVSFRAVERQTPSADAALGLLRVGAAQGRSAVVLEGARALVEQANDATARLLSQEVAMLELLHGQPASTAAGAAGPEGADDPVGVVLRWAAGVRDTHVLGAAAGLLAIARALPQTGPADAINDRNDLLARAAARARLGGVALARAVHDQVAALSEGAAPIGVGLADLPVAGRPDRIAARVARAARTGGQLAFALDLERGLDAEARGDARAALDGFAQAVVIDPEGIEALDGIKRVALATGDRLGAARAGMRLAAVLRVPARSAAEFAMAGQIWEDLAMPAEAGIAYWHALARDPGSEWLYHRLRDLLISRRDAAGLDRLYGHRLAALAEPQSRLVLLLERGRHRLDRLDDRKAAIEDFKRMLKIDPHHPLALRHLATLATQMEYFPQAVRFLESLLGREADEERAATLRLELADTHEAARSPLRAIDVLRQAASARPRDAAPWQRLVDLLLREGDWAGALATLRSWDAVLADPTARAAVWIRIGWLLRDHGRDTPGAAAAFVTSSELDPLGDGIRELITLHDRGGDQAARQAALGRAITDMRQSLITDPLDVPRLRRLQEMCEWASPRPDHAAASNLPSVAAVADAQAGARVAGQLLALAGEEVAVFSPGRVHIKGPLSSDFWTRVHPLGVSGFAAEIWPTLADAVAELFPSAKSRSGQRERISRDAEPRLDWVESAAIALGLPGLEMWMPKREAGPATDESATPLDGNHPSLLLGRGVLTGNASARFRVGRALALLRNRAGVLERLTAADLQTVMSAAGVLAGSSSAAVSPAISDRARTLGKAMNRKDRKMLELESSRFGFEPLDAATFRDSTLAGADRFGLILAGDVAVAVRVAAELQTNADTPVTSASIVGDKRAMDLVQFALSEEYLALRRESGAGEV